VTARTGVRWLPAYGTSEVPVIAANPVDRPEAVAPRLGRAPARRRRAAGGGPRHRGAPARRHRRDPGAQPIGMAGYLPDEATAEAFVTAGTAPVTWAGWSPRAGSISPTGCKEMIKVNGFQVAPAEIEAVLHGHPPCSTAPCSASPTSGPGRCRWPPCSSRPAARQRRGAANARRRHAGHLQAAAPRRRRRRRPADCRRARCCAGRCGTSGPPACSAPGPAD
jgi:acyl-CoA synthetase (AMP-forming)/AMP-acid ligase II